MVRINLTEENLISTAGIADRRFADHSGDIQHGYELGSLTRGLVAYYPMEEGQGQVLHDGALDNLGQINGATWNGSGQVGSDALSFNGSGDTVNPPVFASARDSTVGIFSIATWINTSTTGTRQTIFAESSTTDSDPLLYFRVENDDTVELLMRDDANTNVDEVKSSTTVTDGGLSEASTTFDGNLTTDQSRIGVNTSLGSDGAGSDYFDGLLDDVRIYDRALSQPEIEALAGLTEPSGFLVEEGDVPTLREFERDLGGAVSRESVRVRERRD
jgi:hypothetical protein